MDTALAKKVIPSCVYCPNPPDGEEHWLIRALGTFAGNSYLTGRVCTPCNNALGKTIDQELARTGHTGFTRQLLGIAGRSHHASTDAFDYKTLQPDAPIQIFRLEESGQTLVLERALRRNPDGTLVGEQRRQLVVSMPDGDHPLPFPIAWGVAQLRAAAEARGLLGGRPVAAYVPPPETLADFSESSRDTIRAVFGPFTLDAYTSSQDADTSDVVRTLVRFNLSIDYFRAVAKTAFHYLLWACPALGGDEPEFEAVRAFIRHGVGAPAEFVYTSDSLVSRNEAGQGPDCHMIAAFSIRAEGLFVQVHFFSQPVGPSSPTFAVRLGPRPESLQQSWRRGHIAVYQPSSDGHTGVLRALRTDSEETANPPSSRPRSA